VANEALVRLYAGVYDNDAELFALETEVKGILTKALEYAENVESDLEFCREIQEMQVPVETIKDAKALTLLLREAQKNCPECRLFQGQSNNKARDRNDQRYTSKASRIFSFRRINNSPLVVSGNRFR